VDVESDGGDTVNENEIAYRVALSCLVSAIIILASIGLGFLMGLASLPAKKRKMNENTLRGPRE